MLCDGRSHRFSIRVSGIRDCEEDSATLSGIVGSYWWITGKVFVWHDDANHITTGISPRIAVDKAEFRTSSAIVKNTLGKNETLTYDVRAHRELRLLSIINLAQGEELALWNQQLGYSNFGSLKDGANVQENTQHTYGYDASSQGYANRYSYSIYAFSASSYVQDNITIVATVNDRKSVEMFGQGAFPTGPGPLSKSEAKHPNSPYREATRLSTRLDAAGTYLGNDTDSTSFSFGSTSKE